MSELTTGLEKTSASVDVGGLVYGYNIDNIFGKKPTLNKMKKFVLTGNFEIEFLDNRPNICANNISGDN